LLVALASGAARVSAAEAPLGPRPERRADQGGRGLLDPRKRTHAVVGRPGRAWSWCSSRWIRRRLESVSVSFHSIEGEQTEIDAAFTNLLNIGPR